MVSLCNKLVRSNVHVCRWLSICLSCVYAKMVITVAVWSVFVNMHKGRIRRHFELLCTCYRGVISVCAVLSVVYLKWQQFEIINLLKLLNLKIKVKSLTCKNSH